MQAKKLFQPTAQLKIAVTPDCNNNCPICFNQTTRSRNGEKKSLPAGKIMELIDEASCLGMVGTYWTGGEPLLRFKDLLRFFKHSLKRGLYSTIVTNGGMIDPIGKYKKLNLELLKKAGLAGMKKGEALKLMKRFGLVRIYFSVDNCHTTGAGIDSGVYDRVPLEIISNAITACLKLNFGKIHKLEAIGYQLRISSSTSGDWTRLSDKIIKEILNRSNLKWLESPKPGIKIYANKAGKIFVRKRGIYAHGDAGGLDKSLLSGSTGKGLFKTRCPIFNPRETAYDKGRHHGDLLVNFDGVVYTCGGTAYPVGNVFEESLSSIVESINSGRCEGNFGLSRAVYHRLLKLTKLPEVADAAVGRAFEMIYKQKPCLTRGILSGCGACCVLGSDKNLQRAFIKAYDKEYS